MTSVEELDLADTKRFPGAKHCGTAESEVLSGVLSDLATDYGNKNMAFLGRSSAQRHFIWQCAFMTRRL